VLLRWSIRTKLSIGSALLLVTVSILAFSSFRGVYAYRGLARSISRRATELPLATALAQHVSDLRVALSFTRHWGTAYLVGTDEPFVDGQLLRQEFRANLAAIRATLEEYRQQLRENELTTEHIRDNRREWETVRKFELVLGRVEALDRDEDWLLNGVMGEQLNAELEQLHDLSTELPSYLQDRMHAFAGEVRLQYRTWIVLTWITSILAALLLVLLVRLFYVWVFCPLQTLLHGSRRVAAGEFDHRIQLPSEDEMAELAGAMNGMTRRFQEIRDDLDEQVRQRTKEVVRGEQLASVGFLAAGVAHEINNPLASIALCADSLQERLHDIIQQDDARPDGEQNAEIAVLRTYLRMIQDEAFRCKAITERLLDFARMGDVERQPTNLTELVRGVVDMVGHLGKYARKTVRFEADAPVTALVNAQEIKQVALNLITNSLDSLDPGGEVLVQVQAAGRHAELHVTDNGCGMTEEVLEHLFEPFFTRRRDGQGTGLGMSISYRIVSDHGGRIDVHSDGPGRGSRFCVTLPLATPAKEQEHRCQAA